MTRERLQGHFGPLARTELQKKDSPRAFKAPCCRGRRERARASASRHCERASERAGLLLVSGPATALASEGFWWGFAREERRFEVCGRS